MVRRRRGVSIARSNGRAVSILRPMEARIIPIDTHDELIAALGPRRAGGRSIVLIGGADLASPEDLERVRGFFATLAAYLDASGTAVVDGGTDSGVMRLMGQARETLGASFRLVGVAPRGALTRPRAEGQATRVSGLHPEVLLVPGSQFGDETDWLFGAADHLAGGAAPTLVVNGGQLSHDEAMLRIRAGRRVVAVAGSGRAADELAADEGLRASATLRVLPLDATVAELRAALEDNEP
jgi:hypothetical protein